MAIQGDVVVCQQHVEDSQVMHRLSDGWIRGGSIFSYEVRDAYPRILICPEVQLLPVDDWPIDPVF